MATVSGRILSILQIRILRLREIGSCHKTGGPVNPGQCDSTPVLFHYDNLPLKNLYTHLEMQTRLGSMAVPDRMKTQYM